jgi:hypothetical protein
VIKPVLVATVVVAAVAWAWMVPRPGTTVGWSVGQAVGRAADTGDTIITASGHADVIGASGLRSPYPYLWSLPARTLDPRLRAFDGAIAGPDAATWVVGWSSLASFGAAGRTTEHLLGTRYHPVADLHGVTVYLLDGVTRATPRLPASTAGASAGRRPLIR